jgi:hypothetical protein
MHFIAQFIEKFHHKITKTTLALVQTSCAGVYIIFIIMKKFCDFKVGAPYLKF